MKTKSKLLDENEGLRNWVREEGERNSICIMNVGLPSETIKNAAIRIKELELENERLRKALKRIALYSPLYKNDHWANAIAEHALNTGKEEI